MVTDQTKSYILFHNVLNEGNNMIIDSDSYEEIKLELEKFLTTRQQELNCLNEEDKTYEFVLIKKDFYMTHGEEIFILHNKTKETLNNQI